MISSASKPVVNVAAGVLTRADGRVLLAERPANKASGGHWEFPGGKFDAGENERQALAREVGEEVGVVVDAAVPWLTYDHEYADKVVRLHVYRVTSWHGTPRGQERQRISWEDAAAPSVAPLMEAYGPALRALRLPVLVGIVHADCCGRAELLQRVEQALAGGLRALVLRERTMVPAQFAQLARRVVDMARRYGAKVLIEAGKVQAVHSGADGAHVCSRRLSAMTAPPQGTIWSASCRDAGQLGRAAAHGAAFAMVPAEDPVNGANADWAAFQALIQRSAVPVYATGGAMGQGDLEAALRAGAHGIALPLSAL